MTQEIADRFSRQKAREIYEAGYRFGRLHPHDAVPEWAASAEWLAGFADAQHLGIARTRNSPQWLR